MISLCQCARTEVFHTSDLFFPLPVSSSQISYRILANLNSCQNHFTVLERCSQASSQFFTQELDSPKTQDV